MRRRFTLTDSSLEGDFAQMKLKDSQKKASDLEEVSCSHLNATKIVGILMMPTIRGHVSKLFKFPAIGVIG